MTAMPESSPQIHPSLSRNSRQAPPVVLSIAGFDPSSGAGVTADLKTIAAHRCYGVSAITALTVQSTQGVRRVVPVEVETLAETLDCLSLDLAIAAVRVGMLGTARLVNTVADFIERLDCPNVVLDPIIRSSSGAQLIDTEGVGAIVARLVPLARVITPNVDEALALLGDPASEPIRSLQAMRVAVQGLHRLGAHGVVVTGGHLDEAIDLLSELPAGATPAEGFDGALAVESVFRAPKILSSATHGTGCAFATAIACQLGLGRTLPEAVAEAKEYVRQAMLHAYPMGKGRGPLYHLYHCDDVAE